MDLLDLCLILFLAPLSKGEKWDINVTRHINATLGSDVTIPCTFTYPGKHTTKDVQVYWKTAVRSSFDIEELDKNAFVFHTNNTFVLEKYRGKTKLTGDKDEGNCSLMIQDIKENEPNIYMRVIANGQKYSFKENFVSISLHDVTLATLEGTRTTLLPSFEITTESMSQKTSTTTYVATFVPVAALVIIILVTGIVYCIKHKRSNSFTREDSGYYANFRRASSTQTKREASCGKQDKKLSELKVIDEPIYINMEVHPDQMDQSLAHTDEIYANVDYLK